MKKLYFKTIMSGLVLLSFANAASAAAVVRTAAGANAAAIQAAVDLFRADLGGALNPNTASTFTTGRREINWDGVPDAFAAPNNLPNNFFNVNSPRGVMLTTPCSNATFRVSSTTASGVPVRFGELDPSYTTTFTTFSAQRLFTVISGTAVPCNILTVNFFVPGTSIPATVIGFGIVFTDVDTTGDARILCYDTGGNLLPPGFMAPGAANNGLSFVGVSYNAGERISQCQIVSGPDRLAAGNVDGVGGVNVVAMDDFIYGEPRAAQFHSGDFDGDGVTDSTVYRPSTGTWFTLNSGTNTFTQEQFGLNGDIPVDGDFDGDSRADLCIFRPSNGEWYFKRSSNGTVLGAQFGATGDKPVVGDYDKDGKSDIAIWRPSNGNYFVLRSSTGFSTFFGYPFGTNGDIPVQGGAQ